MWQLVQSGWLFAVLTAELQSLKEFRQFLFRCLAATKNKGEHANDKQLEYGPMPNVVFVRPVEHRWRPLFNAIKFG